MEYKIPTNSDSVRISALERHQVQVRPGNEYYTQLTLYVRAASLRRFADYVIHLERFREIYSYHKLNTLVADDYNLKFSGRLKLWIAEGRLATSDEDREWETKEEENLDFLKNVYTQGRAQHKVEASIED